MWKRLEKGEEDKKIHMCGGQPSLVLYLSFEEEGGSLQFSW
jgi:hypothetical protein